jgi:hypothetical protein
MKNPVDLGEIPIVNKERDKAWGKMARSKRAKQFFDSFGYDLKFPLGRAYYELFCFAWNDAWDVGFKQGFESAMEVSKKRKKK